MALEVPMLLVLVMAVVRLLAPAMMLTVVTLVVASSVSCRIDQAVAQPYTALPSPRWRLVMRNWRPV